MNIPEEIIIGGILGCVGGIIRVAVGMVKILFSRSTIYWGMTAAVAIGYGLIGILLGAVFNAFPALSLLAGFTGLDVVESVLKAFKTEKVIVTSAKARAGAPA